ncbi:Hpt domain-containing protein [Bdellovibrio sp. HCB185ZH]|uniref:Hpt domain-containing protein n=1 Tax=Bdellovibrio sp. HCB185ZH TaxID=3394235 RepID=UPI0039A478FD
METENDLVGVSKQLRTLSGFDSHAFNHLLEDTTAHTVLRILARFCVSLNESIPALERGTNSGESEVVWKAAHKLAGSAEMLGFKEFGKRSKDLSWQLKQSEHIGENSEDVTLYVAQARQLAMHLQAVFPNQKHYL